MTLGTPSEKPPAREEKVVQKRKRGAKWAFETGILAGGVLERLRAVRDWRQLTFTTRRLDSGGEGRFRDERESESGTPA